MASKKIKIEGSKEKATQGEGKPELLRVEVGGLRAKSFQLSVGALERALLAEFPAADAEEWDRTGLLVGDPAAPVRAVAVALDPTVSAIDAAADAGANVLVTHHPAYLTPPTSFQPASSPALNSGAVVYRAIQRGVALMNFHTSLDVSARAQRMLPGMLGLSLRGVVEPKAGCAEKGYGQLCAPAEKMTLGQLAARCTAVACADHREIDAARFDGCPVDVALIEGDVDAEPGLVEVAGVDGDAVLAGLEVVGGELGDGHALGLVHPLLTGAGVHIDHALVRVGRGLRVARAAGGQRQGRRPQEEGGKCFFEVFHGLVLSYPTGFNT